VAVEVQPLRAPTERPRVLVLITLAETGGAQRYVASLLPALVDEYAVTVAAHGDGFLAAAGIAAALAVLALVAVPAVRPARGLSPAVH
jgi:hypothetical protein